MKVAKLNWTHNYEEGRYNYYSAYGCDYYQYSFRVVNSGEESSVNWSCDLGYSCDCGNIYTGTISDVNKLKEFAQEHHEKIVGAYLTN